MFQMNVTYELTIFINFLLRYFKECQQKVLIPDISIQHTIIYSFNDQNMH